MPPDAWTLAEAFWPGPLTLILPRADHVPDAVTGGAGTVGLRVPAQPLALELLAAFGGGVAAPSANRFGRVSPTTAAHVRADLGTDVDLDPRRRAVLRRRRVDHRRPEPGHPPGAPPRRPVGRRPVRGARTSGRGDRRRPRQARDAGGSPAGSAARAPIGPGARDAVRRTTPPRPGSRCSPPTPSPAGPPQLLGEGRKVGLLAPQRIAGLPAGIDALPTGGRGAGLRPVPLPAPAGGRPAGPRRPPGRPAAGDRDRRRRRRPPPPGRRRLNPHRRSFWTPVCPK